MAKNGVGISGWTFPPWRGTFYPKDLVQRRELEYAGKHLTSLEINGTFYSLQRPASFQKWYREVPANFPLAIKGPEFITHVLRLKECQEPLANFFASGLLCLREKMGPILWQFPPNVMLKDDRFEKFMKLLPHDAKSAGQLARRHGPKVEGRAFTLARGEYPVRHAFEFRHPSFLNQDFMATMRAYNVAFVFAHEGGKKAPYTEEPTADFVYARLHGEGKRYARGYPDREIAQWAKKIRSWNKAGLDTYTYFSNEAKVHAPAGALKLIKLLGSLRALPPTKKTA